MSKFNHFIAEVKARINGDTAGVVAARNAKRAEAVINEQISVQNTRLVKLENKLEDAEDKLKDAKYPKELISDDQAYLNAITQADDSIVKLNEEIDQTNFDIEKLEALLEEFEGIEGEVNP